jgi:hypothetical protein
MRAATVTAESALIMIVPRVRAFLARL